MTYSDNTHASAHVCVRERDIWDSTVHWYTLHCVLCYTVTIKIETGPSQWSIWSTSGKPMCMQRNRSVGTMSFFLFCVSCFCPQDVVEEALLLLLITESMVRHTNSRKQTWTCLKVSAETNRLISLHPVQWWGSDKPAARTGRSSPGQPEGRHLYLWPTHYRHGQEGAVCHAFWGSCTHTVTPSVLQVRESERVRDTIEMSVIWELCLCRTFKWVSLSLGARGLFSIFSLSLICLFYPAWDFSSTLTISITQLTWPLRWGRSELG